MTTNNSYSAEWLIDKVKSNPEGLLLVAAGCALLLRASSSTRPNSQPYSRSEGSQASELVRSVSEQVSDYAAQAKSYATSTAESVRTGSEQIAENLRLSERVDNLTQRQPLAIAVAGLLAGGVVALAFPTTDVERRAVGPIGDELKAAGSNLAERMSEGVQAASDSLRNAAADRGLDADGLAKAGADIAQAFTGALSGDKEQAVRARPDGMSKSEA